MQESDSLALFLWIVCILKVTVTTFCCFLAANDVPKKLNSMELVFEVPVANAGVGRRILSSSSHVPFWRMVLLHRMWFLSGWGLRFR